MRYSPLLLPLLLATVASAATYDVSPAGDDAADGSAASPWRTLRHAVDRLEPGDTLRVHHGVYRESVTLTRGGEPGRPVLDGADPLGGGGWRDEGGEVYSRDWSHAFRWNTWAPDDPPQLTHPDDDYHRLIGRAEQAFYEGMPLRQVLEVGHLARGTFAADVGAGRLYVRLPDGRDPREPGVAIEASARPRLIGSAPGVSHVVLRGLTLRRAANHAPRGALHLEPDTSQPNVGWTIEDCVFEQNNGVGAKLAGSGHAVRRSAFRDNGQLGLAATRSHDTIVSESIIEGNNRKNYDRAWEAGGAKVVLSRGFAFDRCLVRDNRGPGLWYDIGCEAGVVRRCRLEDNDQSGLYYEISFGLRAHDNVMSGNATSVADEFGQWAHGGVRLFASRDCVVERNEIVGNRDGIGVFEHARRTHTIDGPTGPDGEGPIHGGGYVVRDNRLAHNRGYNVALWWDTPFFGPHPSGGDDPLPPNDDPASAGLLFEGNVYEDPGRANFLFGVEWRDGSRTFDSPEAFAEATGGRGEGGGR